MTASDALPTQIRSYLEAVHRQLGDLGPAERAELTAPVEARLAELSEHPDSLAEIERQFGEPARLAADLRSAAGYPPASAPANGTSLAHWLRGSLRHPAVVAVVRYLTSLRPAWWAVRGYLLLGGGLAVLGPDRFRLHTIGSYKSAFTDDAAPHSTLVWAFVPAVAIVASIVLGLRTARLPHKLRLVVLVLDGLAILVLLAFPTWWLAPAGAYFAGMVN